MSYASASSRGGSADVAGCGSREEYLRVELHELERTLQTEREKRGALAKKLEELRRLLDERSREASALKDRLDESQARALRERRSREDLEQEVGEVKGELSEAEEARDRLARDAAARVDRLRDVADQLEMAAVDDPSLAKLSANLAQTIEDFAESIPGEGS